MSSVHAIPRSPHRIEAAEIPDRYARGWHCRGLASDYGPPPQQLTYFGTELVAYRGEDGQVYILDAFCPHMGANLSKGHVEGCSIRCPFHAWRWGPDGICDDIPYAKRIPPKAVIKSWPVMEENGLLFVWNDPQNGQPIPEQRIPRMEECFSDEWSPWVVQKMTIHTNCRELIDNISDAAHFGPIHGAPCRYFRNEFRGHVALQEMRGSSERLAEDGDLLTVATYYGPAYQITEMSGQMGGIAVDSRLLNSHVPVDLNTFDLRFGVTVKKNPELSDEQNMELVEAYVKQSQDAFYEDVEIWHSKTRIDNPVLCDGDGPVNRLRQWYQQFYTDVADLGPELADPKEYFVNSHNPVPAYRRASQ